MKIAHQPTQAINYARPKPVAAASQQTQEPTDQVTLSSSQPSMVRKAAAFVAATVGSALATGLCAAAGALYVGTVLGPVIVGASKADVGPKSLEEAVWQHQNPMGSMINGSGSLFGSVLRETTAPLTWGMDGGRAAFRSIYQGLTG